MWKYLVITVDTSASFNIYSLGSCATIVSKQWGHWSLTSWDFCNGEKDEIKKWVQKIKHIIVRWYFVCDKQIEWERVEHAGQETMFVMIVLKADLAEKVTGFVKTEWAIWLNEQRLFQSEKKNNSTKSPRLVHTRHTGATTRIPE